MVIISELQHFFTLILYLNTIPVPGKLFFYARGHSHSTYARRRGVGGRGSQKSVCLRTRGEGGSLRSSTYACKKICTFSSL